MQIKEMIYVLDNVKGCMQAKDACNHECAKCSMHMSNSTVFDTIDRVTNLLDTISYKSTRQNF